MRNVSYYKCDYCGKEFESKMDCLEHESSHIKSFCGLTNGQLADKMEELSRLSESHHLFNMILDMPVGSFQNLVEEVASRLRGEFDE